MHEVKEVTLDKAFRLIHQTAYPKVDDITGDVLEHGSNICLIGSAGVGKTKGMEALAERTGYKLITLITSQMNAEQFQGIPTPGSIEVTNPDGSKTTKGAVQYLLDTWQAEVFAHADEGQPVMLFFDELRNAPADVLAASLNILADRKINGIPLPADTVIVAATNSERDSVSPTIFHTPIQGRFTWYAVTQNPQDWCAGAINGWGKRMTHNESVIRYKIVTRIREGNATLMEPIDNGGEPLHLTSVRGYTPESEEAAQFAWRSPRSWDNCIKELSGLFTKGNDPKTWYEDAKSLTIGTVGYLGFVEVKDILKNLSTALCTVSITGEFTTEQEKRNGAEAFGSRLFHDVTNARKAGNTAEENAQIGVETAGNLFAGYQQKFGSWSELNSYTDTVIESFMSQIREHLKPAFGKGLSDEENQAISDTVRFALDSLTALTTKSKEEAMKHLKLDDMVIGRMGNQAIKEWNNYYDNIFS